MILRIEKEGKGFFKEVASVEEREGYLYIALTTGVYETVFFREFDFVQLMNESLQPIHNYKGETKEKSTENHFTFEEKFQDFWYESNKYDFLTELAKYTNLREEDTREFMKQEGIELGGTPVNLEEMLEFYSKETIAKALATLDLEDEDLKEHLEAENITMYKGEVTPEFIDHLELKGYYFYGDDFCKVIKEVEEKGYIVTRKDNIEKETLEEILLRTEDKEIVKAVTKVLDFEDVEVIHSFNNGGILTFKHDEEDQMAEYLEDQDYHVFKGDYGAVVEDVESNGYTVIKTNDLRRAIGDLEDLM